MNNLCLDHLLIFLMLVNTNIKNINVHVNSQYKGSQNFKIPGSLSGRYFSDFGIPKMYLTSPNKKEHYDPF